MPDELACSEIVLRGIRERDLLRDPVDRRVTFRYQAFLLRQDETELSVQRAALETHEETFARLPRSSTLASLHTGRVRDLGLRIVEDVRPSNPAHAVILGLPSPYGADAAEAVRLAVELAEMARLAVERAGE